MAPRRVPDPGVAVVPVPLTADLLGQARCRGRDKAARRGIGHQLERDRRAVQRFTPPARVRRLRQPRLPEGSRVGEEPLHLGHSHLTGAIGGASLQQHPAHLAGLQGDLRMQVALRVHLSASTVLVTWLPDDVQSDGLMGTPEHGTVLRQVCLVGRAAIVEPGSHVDVERHVTSDAAHHSDDPVPRGGHCAGCRRHEVGHLTHARLSQETGDEDCRVREVQLLGGDGVCNGAHSEVTPSAMVQEGPEHARRVEAWRAEPVDRSVGADKGARLEVADQTVFSDGRVVIEHSVSPCCFGVRARPGAAVSGGRPGAVRVRPRA